MLKPDAILAADIHLRDDVPVCRTDDFHAAMFRKLKFINDLADKHDCPVLVAGDMFHKWKVSPWLLGKVLNLIHGWAVIPGQHDLPQHRLEAYDQSSLHVLDVAGRVDMVNGVYFLNAGVPDRDIGSVVVQGFPWGVPFDKVVKARGDLSIALVHHLVYQGKPPFPGAEKCGSTVETMLKHFHAFDLVVTGDNHQTFTCKNALTGGGSPILVNPGSMMRTTAAQADHKPCVFLWYSGDNRVEPVYLPIEEGVVSREHIEVIEDRDERAAVFAASLDTGDIDLDLNFGENVRRFCQTNEIAKPTRDIVERMLNG